jgi:hypothetical protein
MSTISQPQIAAPRAGTAPVDNLEHHVSPTATSPMHTRPNRPIPENVIARFKVIEWRLAVERTDDPNDFELSVNQPRQARDVAARFTVDASGSYLHHERASSCYRGEEVNDWVRRAVWKVINHKVTRRIVIQW